MVQITFYFNTCISITQLKVNQFVFPLEFHKTVLKFQCIVLLYQCSVPSTLLLLDLWATSQALLGGKHHSVALAVLQHLGNSVEWPIYKILCSHLESQYFLSVHVLFSEFQHRSHLLLDSTKLSPHNHVIFLATSNLWYN